MVLDPAVINRKSKIYNLKYKTVLVPAVKNRKSKIVNLK